jgi:hypothetical protein
MCFLMRKNIKRAKSKKKFGQKKRKEKNSKRKGKMKEKGAHKEHLNSSIIYGAFLPCPYFRCYLSYLFHSLVCHNWCRNTYRLATRTSALDIYSILLSVTELCATYIYLFFMCLPSSTYILQISTEKDPCNLGGTSLHVSRTSHRLYRLLLYVGKNLVRTW